MIEYENLKKFNKKIFKKYKLEINKFLSSNNYILGKNVFSFEKNFSKYIGAKYCVGVNSGLDAMVLSLEALEIPKGKEVLVASNTYIATILAIIKAGLIPKLIEPSIVDYNIDVSKISKKISKNTKALLITHLYGRACNMDKILKICKKNKLLLLEDCAQSHGAKFKNKKVGSFGDAGCFSFYPTKNLGALGDGGAIVVNNLKVYKKLLSLRNYGSNLINKKKYDYIGSNSRLDEIQAIFLNLKLKLINRINNKKNILARIYDKYLSNEDIVLPAKNKKIYNVYHIYNIRLKNKTIRDSLKKFLEQNKIFTDIHYPVAPHIHKVYKKFFLKEKYPISLQIHNTTLSLPISFFHTSREVKKVCQKINFFLNKKN